MRDAYSITVKALRQGFGVSSTWFVPRDAGLVVSVHMKLPGLMTRSRAFPLTDLEGLPIRWDEPPYQVEEAAHRLRQIGLRYVGGLDRVLAGDPEARKALIEAKRNRGRSRA